MPKTARIVIPNMPHHVIQRGNRKQDVFFDEADYRMYLSLLKEKCEESGAKILAYCLMSNHVHLIVTPSHEQGLRFLGEAHRRYTRYINARHDWRGYLWQGRFSSFPMDDRYLYEALRYVELNPVRAGLCGHPAQYRWSSARQRINAATGDYKAYAHDVGAMIGEWEAYWAQGLAKDEFANALENNESLQKPLGNIATREAPKGAH